MATRCLPCVMLLLGVFLLVAPSVCAGSDDSTSDSHNSTHIISPTSTSHVTSTVNSSTAHVTSSVNSSGHVTPTPSTVVPVSSSGHVHITPTGTVSSTVIPVTPAPSPPPQQTGWWHVMRDANDSVCFNMSAVIHVTIYKNQSDNNNTILLNGTRLWTYQILNTSTCNPVNLMALILIQEKNLTDITDGGQLTLGFNFTGTDSKDEWSLSEMLLSYTFNDNRTDKFAVKGDSVDAYFQGVGFQRYFRCNFLNVSFKNSNTTENINDLTPFVLLQNLSIQVFRFRNTPSGELINGVTCEVESNQGSPIVPIAVGVALGCLIIIVFVAYLIGRFRTSRKGYEQLN